MRALVSFGFALLLIAPAAAQAQPARKPMPYEVDRLVLITAAAAEAQLPVLKPSDVVFMYQAPSQVYTDYGATVLAWGGTPKTQSLQEAEGIKFFGSVGMVTEFNRYYERFPDTYEQGLCRDLQGKPYKVPWLTDHTHKGVPYWWCCTRQPLFRQYISERVLETVKAGAYGVHIDDHLGTAGSLWLGSCFCEICIREFREHLKALPAAQCADLGVKDANAYNFREELQAWLGQAQGRKFDQHPLWPQYRIFQLRGAAAFMKELRALAEKTAGKPVPMSANACLLWGPHLNDYQALDFLSAEVEHHASTKKFSDDPLVAYRMADAVRRPLASTASGGDWAFIKANNLPGLVEGWIALGYAAGNSIMAPHHQWCYTSEKGTHWYDGPKEKFAPYYRFVRANTELFDGCRTHADVTIAYAQRTFDREPARLIGLCNKLAAAQISYRLALGGNEVVDHPLRTEDLRGPEPVLVLNSADFMEPDRAVLAKIENARRFEDPEKLMASLKPAARVEAAGPVRVLPRVSTGSAAIHVLNWNYQADRDQVEPLKGARMKLDLRALGIPNATRARFLAPGREALSLEMRNGEISLPDLGVWGVVHVTQS